MRCAVDHLGPRKSVVSGSHEILHVRKLYGLELARDDVCDGGAEVDFKVVGVWVYGAVPVCAVHGDGVLDQLKSIVFSKVLVLILNVELVSIHNRDVSPRAVVPVERSGLHTTPLRRDKLRG